MKKLISVILCFAVLVGVLAFAGCKKNNDGQDRRRLNSGSRSQHRARDLHGRVNNNEARSQAGSGFSRADDRGTYSDPPRRKCNREAQRRQLNRLERRRHLQSRQRQRSAQARRVLYRQELVKILCLRLERQDERRQRRAPRLRDNPRRQDTHACYG